jgi:hypothetical protein
MDWTVKEATDYNYIPELQKRGWLHVKSYMAAVN